MAAGVRSSWEASEVNCFSVSKDCWRRENIRLKVEASCATSSLEAGGASIRLERSPPSPMASAVLRMSSMGRKARLVMRKPPPAAARRKSGTESTATRRIIRKVP